MELLKNYPEKTIGNIDESDENVAVFGTVVNSDESGFVIDDGNKTIQVVMENNLKENSYVRVFGKVVHSGKDMLLYGEAVQDVNKIDKLLYKKISKMINEA